MPAKPPKQRLDLLLVERGLFESREKAQRAILAGQVYLGTALADKVGHKVPADAQLVVKGRDKYVGRGGYKLEGALDHFGVDPAALVCLDIGSSTGGFTDCLLQRGARLVYAIDVGTNQLAYRIREDARVIVRENTNARYLEPTDFPETPALVVGDLSFISLTLILPAALRVAAPGARFLMLIKPQFELRREQIGKGGIVRDPALHAEAVEKIRAFTESTGGALRWLGVTDSPITGTDGNREFLCHLEKSVEQRERDK
jgi:23S rRNA (cytidine1920-2'-O)/16S rRNA (cytidine1409-2'-O)-methyltransferase